MKSRKNYRYLFLIITIIVIITSCQKSTEYILKDNTTNVINNNSSQSNNDSKKYETTEFEEDNFDNKTDNNNKIKCEIAKINKEINGVKTKLNIDLDVKTYPNIMFGIYDTSPVDINVAECYEYFFKNYSKENIIHLYDEKFYKKRYNLENKSYKEIVLCYLDKSTGRTANYDINNEFSLFTYLINKKEKFTPERPGNLLRRKQNFILPDAELLKEAENISYDLYSFVFKDYFKENFTKSFSGVKETIPEEETKSIEVYLVTYNRLINGLPIMYDYKIAESYNHRLPKLDELEVWTKNGKIIYAAGNIRKIQLKEKVLTISYKEALTIYEDEFNNSVEKGEFRVTRFELMYYPTFTDDADTTELYSKQVGAAYIKYIPVWVIASESPNGEFILVINAIDGSTLHCSLRS